MTADWTTIFVPLVLFAATFIRSAFGFGEALIAVPLLALMMPIDVAAPIAVMASIVVAVVVVIQDWRHIHFRSAFLLVVATLFGTPVGLLLLMFVEERVVKVLLGVLIIGFALYCLLSRRKATLSDDRYAWLFGFGAGVLGGAYGVNGPPLVVYGSLRGWTPQHFRATLQGYFLPASLLVFGGYAVTGLWTETVTRHFLWSLPAIVIAIFLGRILNQRMHGAAFFKYVYVGLIAVGVVLLVQALA